IGKEYRCASPAPSHAIRTRSAPSHDRLEDQDRAPGGSLAQHLDRLAEAPQEGKLELPVVPGRGIPGHGLAGHETEHELPQGSIRYADTEISELRAVGHLPSDHCSPAGNVGACPRPGIPRTGERSPS